MTDSALISNGPGVGPGNSPVWSPTALEGAVVVVTGTSSGIGLGIALALGSAGANVVAVGRDPNRLAACASEFASESGRCVTLAIDVTEADAGDRILDLALTEFGKVTGLINNAGIVHHLPFLESGGESLDEQYAVNLRAPYVLSRALVPHFESGSSIVFISSGLARGGWQNVAGYSATKGGVEALMRALAVELAPRGIRVNAVSPGYVQTPMMSVLDEDEDVFRSVVSRTPAQRLGQPADIGAACVYVLSRAATFVTGTVLNVDGGWDAYCSPIPLPSEG